MPPFCLHSLSSTAKERGFHLAGRELHEPRPTPSSNAKRATQLSGLYRGEGACHLSRAFPPLSEYESMSLQWPPRPPALWLQLPHLLFLCHAKRGPSQAQVLAVPSAWNSLKLDLTPPSGLCPVRLLPSTILFRFTSLPTHSFICLSIYCCSLSCPRMNTQLGQELCCAPWCSLRTQTQSWHGSGTPSTFVEGINGPSRGGSLLSNGRALICRLSAMSKLILQNTGAGDCSPQQTRGPPAPYSSRICRAGLPDPHLQTFCPLFHGNSLFFGS